MKPVFSYLRSYGFRSVCYFDDTLLIGTDYNCCSDNLEKTLDTLKRTGFAINYDKSALIPSRYIIFLGFYIDSSLMIVSLPEDKKEEIIDMASQI